MIRCVLRLAALVVLIPLALAEAGIRIVSASEQTREPIRAAWLHRWCAVTCRLIGMHVAVRGPIPKSGLVVCNHLSYLDIIALSSLEPCVFLSKAEVADWPVFGWFAQLAGTLFVDRTRRGEVSAVSAQMQEVLGSSTPMIFFPEGTSTDGSTVLPFKTSLFETVVRLGCVVTAAGIDYDLPGGSVADEVCYWRDMTLVPHLLNLLTKPRIEARITFSEPVVRKGDRKTIARALREQVAALRLPPEERGPRETRNRGAPRVWSS